MTDWRTRTSSAEQIIGDTGALTPVRRAPFAGLHAQGLARTSASGDARMARTVTSNPLNDLS